MWKDGTNLHKARERSSVCLRGILPTYQPIFAHSEPEGSFSTQGPCIGLYVPGKSSQASAYLNRCLLRIVWTSYLDLYGVQRSTRVHQSGHEQFRAGCSFPLIAIRETSSGFCPLVVLLLYDQQLVSELFSGHHVVLHLLLLREFRLRRAM